MAEELREWAVSALSALAHDSRLQVHRLLVQAGDDGLSAGAIAEHLNMPASSLSFHLAHMQASEMVRQRREGRSLIYTVNFECMDVVDGVPAGELLPRGAVALPVPGSA